MKRFLSLKHWQLFAILVGIPFGINIISFILSIIADNSTPLVKLFPLGMIVYIGVFFGWFYSLGTNLYKKLPESVNMNISLFKIFLLIPVVYMILLSVYMTGIFSNQIKNNDGVPIIFGIIVPLHLFSIFCIFYCLYFNAKVLKSVELQRSATFSDFAGEFFLLWFFPIGVWIIQPRINKLFANINNKFF